MKDKFASVRNTLLGDIESGHYPVGGKLPGARELANRLKASFMLVQHALSSLEQDGIVDCVPRNGTYVREGWRDRLVRNHFVAFRPELPWLGRFKGLLAERLPGIRLCHGFNRGMFELRTTVELQRDRNSYLDLTPLLPPGFLDGNRYFLRPFQSFCEARGRRFGVPFIFSPRVMVYNKALLAHAGLSPPEREWDWGTFIGYVKALRRHFPADRVINFNDNLFFWMNFVFRAGGRLFSRAADGTMEVWLDRPETRRGLELVREFRSALGHPGRSVAVSEDLFLSGGMALAVTDRAFCSRLWGAEVGGWNAVPLPDVPGGCGAMAQSANVVCVRRECADLRLATEYVRFMLGEEAQTFIGRERYGLPVLKKAAMASLDPEDPRDVLFMTQMNHMSAEFNVDSPVLAGVLRTGIERLLHGSEPLDKGLDRLASAFRTFMDIRNVTVREELAARAGIPEEVLPP